MPLRRLDANDISYVAVLGSMARCGRWEEAVELLKRRGLRNPLLRNALMKAMASSEQWQRCLEMLDATWDQVSYSTALSACPWAVALVLLEHMQRRLPLERSACHAAIGACGRCARWQRGLELFRAMPSMQIGAWGLYSSYGRWLKDDKGI